MTALNIRTTRLWPTKEEDANIRTALRGRINEFSNPCKRIVLAQALRGRINEFSNPCKRIVLALGDLSNY